LEVADEREQTFREGRPSAVAGQRSDPRPSIRKYCLSFRMSKRSAESGRWAGGPAGQRAV